MTIRHRRVAAVAAAAALALSLASCSSSGGKQEEQQASGGSAGQVANTPRFKIAMITHEAPGDTFWDLIRKGAEAAAAKDNIQLVYSNDPEAPQQANLIQSAINSDVDAIASTMPNVDAITPALKKAVAKDI